MKKNSILNIIVVLIHGFCLLSCINEEKKQSSALGIMKEENYSGYDLHDIQNAGELIAITITGPDTYYEYKNKEIGLQFEIAEQFASFIGVKLRMETAKDTTELLKKLLENEVDLIALEFTDGTYDSTNVIKCGAWSINDNNTRKQWIVRKESQNLAKALTEWYNPDIKENIRKRESLRFSSGGIRRHMKSPMIDQKKGIISSYDNNFIRHSQNIGWDWRLMAAQCYQESGFDPEAISWAGAKGLMQIMPQTAEHLGLAEHDIHNPDKNIAAAAKYLNELNRKFSDIHDRLERIKFVLAAYNGGAGHIRDAMSLAKKHGKNPKKWEDVGLFVLNLSKPQYYNDPSVEYGYMRGEETYGYVNSIIERWNGYRGHAPGVISFTQPSPAKRNKKYSTKSKVLTPEQLEEKYIKEINNTQDVTE